MGSVDAVSPGRRQFLARLPLLLAALGLPLSGAGLAAPTRQSQPFSFDLLTERMRRRAAQGYVQPDPAQLPPALTGLDYDRYNWIGSRGDRALWQGSDTLFRVQAHHLGGLFLDPVAVHIVEDGRATEHDFTTEDFIYGGGLEGLVDRQAALAGVAGLRVHYPLNRPDFSDELVSFVGASYFRALGRGNVYGVSARGIAINTGLDVPEEFPRFSAFYLLRPGRGDEQITLCAALDGPSVTGAFRFVVSPGADTVIDVTSRLFFRRDVAQLGLAPMTSMFLFNQANRTGFNDFRPQVHDSDGLQIVRSNGEAVWRPLNNPAELAQSYFGEVGPKSFGLHQRSRALQDFQDPVAEYHLRPSLDVEPVGDWGAGHVRLVELPTLYETVDNIAAFWTPQRPASAGQALEYAYRLRWGMLPPDLAAAEAVVDRTGAGHTGVSGSSDWRGFRKFVVDFRGTRIGQLPGHASLATVPSISGGTILNIALGKVAGTDIWRLVMDVRADGHGPVELSVYLVGFEQKLSETWAYQWVQ